MYGLYASFVPTVVYAFFGTSGQLAVGPVALVSLLVEAGLSDALTKGECPEYYEDDDKATRRMLGASDDSLAGTCPDAYADLVFVAMFFVGSYNSGPRSADWASSSTSWATRSFPVLRVWCSHHDRPVAVQVLARDQHTEVPVLPRDHQGHLHESPEGQGPLDAVSVGCHYVLYAEGREGASDEETQTFGWMKPLGPLIICTLSLVMMIIPGLGDTLRDDYGVQTIGLVPSGLPPFTLPRVLRDVPSKASTVLPTAISAALIGFMESIAIGKIHRGEARRGAFGGEGAGGHWAGEPDR